MKNQQLTSLVMELKEVSRKNNVNIWKRVASDLERPSRLLREVNLTRLNRYCKANDVVVVPGKVLSMGLLDKKITIAAYKFSKSALIKIKESGSSAISIYDLAKKNPKGSKVRIIG
ncbi:50S ribosomal protein L18e [archaeon]|jgi:large subunit ribosomal protein L18e|nr:50S ribosomal protein L18e [archaeon]MBT3721406.1 50S ribosomal protein L18e [archaeon]MBT4022713.1 50S ribosomal protein L18e [archaeon]MBT4273093.1 50S ribosomal protein L18e [archaeon]MBT4461074.1 50S ribosomal protein L18e [archaeon]